MVMKNKQFFIYCLLLILIFGLAVAQKGETDYGDMAKRIVKQSANVNEGEHVWITGSVRDMALMEEIAVEVRKAGAFSVIQVSSEQMNWRMFAETPDKYDSQSPTFGLKLSEIIDVQISVSVGDNLNLFAEADPKRLAAIGKAFEPINEVYVKRKIRGVNIGNEMYPTKNLAKRWGVPLDDLEKIFWQGVTADYKQVEATGVQLKKNLTSAREIHLTHPNGTDLKMKIENRPVFVSDGIISEEDMNTGSAACQAYLPAGEVMLAPVRGTAQGKVVIDRMFYAGKEINGLTLSFAQGKLVSMTSESDITRIKADYDAAGAGKEEFAFIDIGINPDIKIIPGSKMTSWIPAGMVTVGIGDNSWAGGDNNISYSLFGHMEGTTVEADGKTLVADGKLNL
jgi:leucyl aminopeptidase (aminopeptidase T)